MRGTINWLTNVIEFQKQKTIKPTTAVSLLTGYCDGIHPTGAKMSNIDHMMYDPLRYIEDMKRELQNKQMEETMRFEMPVANFRMKPADNTNWEFHSSADADINWKDIKDSLTYKEPLALVTRNYKEYPDSESYVVVSKQLMDKANAINIEDIPDIITTVSKRVFLIDNNFSEWVDWAKAVKAAKWPEGIKSTLNVVLPTI